MLSIYFPTVSLLNRKSEDIKIAGQFQEAIRSCLQLHPLIICFYGGRPHSEDRTRSISRLIHHLPGHGFFFRTLALRSHRVLPSVSHSQRVVAHPKPASIFLSKANT